MAKDGSIAGELQRRLTAANKSFWRLRRLWRDRKVSVGTKARVYAAVVRGTLLYGAESWVLRAVDVRKLAVFDRGRLRWVAGVRRIERVSNVELVERVRVKAVEEVVVERRWRWLGHVLRMDGNRWLS